MLEVEGNVMLFTLAIRREIVICNSCRDREIKNNAWVTANNDFFRSRVRWFAKDFHAWRSHKWKLLVNHLRSDHKIVLQGNECIILFHIRQFMTWTHHSAKNSHRSLISPNVVTKDGLFWINIVTSPQLICDVTRTQGTGIVTSYSSIVFACAHWCKLYNGWPCNCGC